MVATEHLIGVTDIETSTGIVFLGYEKKTLPRNNGVCQFYIRRPKDGVKVMVL